MIRQLTIKEREKKEQKIIAQALIWLEKYSPEQVAMFIWNKYGYLSGVKDGVVRISGCHGLTEVK